MSYAWKEIQDWEDHKRKCRISQATHLSSNLYERMREHTVRIVREHEENIALAAADLGCSESTVRKYMKFVPFEHLMRDSTLENRFDWRSMTREKWVKLLCKHPVFISRLPTRNNLYYSTDVCNILLAQPQLSSYFDLQEWNHLELDFSWSKLLRKHPGFAASCDFSVIAALAAKELLDKQPQLFEKIKIETLWPYHWKSLIEHQPQIAKKMEAKPHSEWPFNFKVLFAQSSGF